MRKLTAFLAALVLAAVCGPAFAGEPAAEEQALVNGMYAEYACSVPEGAEGQQDELIETAVTILRSRLDAMGYPSATVRREGDGIRVEVPDVHDRTVLEKIGAPGRLEFVSPDGEVFMTGEMVSKASYFYNEGDHEVAFILTEEGTELFAEVTAASIGKTVSIYLDGEILVSATVQSAITSGSGVINGMGTAEHAKEIAARISTPELPLKLTMVASEDIYDPETLQAMAEAEKADEAVALKLGNREVTRREIREATESQLSYMAYLYSMYGYTYDTTDPDNIAAARESAIAALKQDMALTAKAAELGLDRLTDEEAEAVAASAQAAYEKDLSYVKAYLLTDTAGMDAEAMEKAAQEKMAELGYPYEHYVEQATKELIRTRIRDYAVRDVAVTEEEIRAEYESRVEKDRSTYEGKAGAWAAAADRSGVLYYTPAGVRRVKQILTKFREEDNAEINAARQQGDAQALAEAQEKAYANIDEEADAILAALDAGADWETLMDEKNQDPGMKTYLKGYAVSVDMTNFDPAFVEAAMALEKPGDYSGKARGIYGYYIIRYESDEPEGPVGYDGVKADIAEELLSAKQEEAYNAAVETWIREAGIEENPDALK